MHYVDMLLFDIYPYLAGTVFLVGSWLRYDYGQYSWRAGSSQILDKSMVTPIFATLIFD